jgi:hypothetical protein
MASFCLKIFHVSTIESMTARKRKQEKIYVYHGLFPGGIFQPRAKNEWSSSKLRKGIRVMSRGMWRRHDQTKPNCRKALWFWAATAAISGQNGNVAFGTETA